MSTTGNASSSSNQLQTLDAPLNITQREFLQFFTRQDEIEKARLNATVQNVTQLFLNRQQIQPTGTGSAHGGRVAAAHQGTINQAASNVQLPNRGHSSYRSPQNGSIVVLQLNCMEANCTWVGAGKRAFVLHLKADHGIDEYRCRHTACGESFAYLHLIKKHIREHHQQMTCKLCHHGPFKTYERLEKHYQLVDQLGIYQCSRCRECKTLQEDVKRHMKVACRRGPAGGTINNFVVQPSSSRNLRSSGGNAGTQ